MENEIPLFEIDWGRGEICNAVDSISRGSHWAKGPYVSEFEERIEQYLGVNHAVVVNSGTSALLGALRACGVGSGDEVIIPSFTFIATANVVKLVGATPVFADVERETFGLDPESVKEKISPDTKAVLPVHVYGGACEIDELQKIADENDLLLIEDAAEAFGADSKGRKLGTIGDAAGLSFCQNKIITTGEGGAIVTDEDELAEKASLFRSHGRASTDYFESSGSGNYVTLGTNHRMADLAAAIGCAQLDRVQQLIRNRRRAAQRLTDGLESVEGVQTPDAEYGKHVFQLYTVVLPRDMERASLIDSLDTQGISSKVYWDTPVHQTEYYRKESNQAVDPTLPITNELADRVLSLPMHPNLSTNDTDRIVEAIADGFSRLR